MDNTGNYISYGDLLAEMARAGNNKVTKSAITLSNKQSDAGGDIFEFSVSGSDPQPQVGDVLEQAGWTEIIIGVLTGPDRVRVETADGNSVIVNGTCNLLHSDEVPRRTGEQLIAEAMQWIDNLTGSYFNKREGTYDIEGNNTALMHLPVPIIQIDELLINSTKTPLTEGEEFDFVAFKGRQKPTDDRENPRIKLNVGRGRDSIYVSSLTSRMFVKNTLTQITGAFGYLESDGSTPAAIQRATKLLVMQEIENPIGGGTDATTGAGPLKRLKVDLHEQEFFESQENKDSARSTSTGNAEVDRIIARYRTPIRIKGSFRIRAANEDDFVRSGQIL